MLRAFLSLAILISLGGAVSAAPGDGAGSAVSAGSAGATGAGSAAGTSSAAGANSAAAPISNEDFRVPALTGPVVDEADLLRPDVARYLSRGLRNLKASGGSQITVVTVPSLGRDSIEQASIKTTDAWKLGGASADNGVLVLVAPNERKVRIEVGQGLEGSLTDAYSNRIIQDTILPAFRSGDYDQGVFAGVVEVIKKTDPNVDLKSLFGAKSGREVSSGGGGAGRWIFYLIGLIIFISIISGGGGGRRRRGSMSPWGAAALGYGLGRLGGGGGGWGGSGGGGGWSGGGGGFSGGGASGDW